MYQHSTGGISGTVRLDLLHGVPREDASPDLLNDSGLNSSCSLSQLIKRVGLQWPACPAYLPTKAMDRQAMHTNIMCTPITSVVALGTYHHPTFNHNHTDIAIT
eukprot:11041989-Ditylum_brightwellii.AAC.1